VDKRLAAEWPVRRERLYGQLEQEEIDALFLPPSADLEYLTGVERDLPSFGEIIYAHNWVTGAFFVPGEEPLFVLPRMFVAFHFGGNVSGEATFGIYRPWIVKVNGSATLNGRLESGAFRAFGVAAALVRRF